MSLSARWHRLDAARWVRRLLVLQTVEFGLITAAVLFGGLVAGAAWVAVIPAVLTGLSGWLAHAWDAGRRWTWWVAMTLALLGTGVDMVRLSSGSPLLALWRLLLDAALLALLVHPDSNARRTSPAPLPQPSGPPSWRAPTR